MINHIAAKFLGLIYSAVPPEIFRKNHQDVIEVLRSKFPRFDVAEVNDIHLNLSGEQLNTEKKRNVEIYMVSADGKLGIKIGNQGVFLSIDGYLPFNELVDEFKLIVENVTSTLSITHFSQVILRNINLFPEISANIFGDIRNQADWGRQSLSTLSQDFLCNGAATRHEYLSRDFTRRIQISSGIVMAGTHSYIPQEEWAIWRLRGGLPVAEDVNLLIDITGVQHQSSIKDSEKQHIVKEYDWNEIVKQLGALHDDVNGVYSDIIVEATV